LRFLRSGIFILITLAVCCLERIGLWTASAQKEGVEELQEPESITTSFSVERPIVKYQAGNLRDPFRVTVRTKVIQGPGPAEEVKPIKSRKPLPRRLQVQGLVWGGVFPQAIIDNRVVKVGDRISLGTKQVARIIDIDKEGVTIVFEGENYKLPAPARVSTSSKKPSGGDNEKNP